MSQQSDETRLIELAHHADEARSRLKNDVEAIAYKLSLQNLKHEAIDLGHEMASDVKATVARWGHRARDVSRKQPIAVALTLGFGGLLFAGIARRNRALLYAALTCGAGALGATLLSAKIGSSKPLLTSRSSGKLLGARGG